MKYIKILLKISILFIITVTLTLLIDYIRINISYKLNKTIYKETYDVMGNKNNYVPQGLTYSNKYNIILQTSYNSKHKVSKLYITNYKTKKLIKELKLLNSDNTNNTKHVGGIATDNNKVWITNDYEVNEYYLEDILNTNNNYIKSNKTIKLPNRGDFCCYNNGILWIGDFFLNPFYPVPDNNPLMMAYKVNENINYQEPIYIVSIPIMIQGLTITNNNEYIFTSSFTNLMKSNLSIYNNILNNNYDYYELNNKKIPYYKITDKDLIKNIKLPPMAEGLFYKNNDLYILFENSSDTYFYAFPKMNKIIKINLDKIKKN